MPDLQIIIGNELATVAAKTTLDLSALVESMQLSGMTNEAIKQTLLADLTNGGRLFGAYSNAVKNTVKNGIGMSSNLGSRETFEKAGVKEFQWITVGDDKVCPDCDPRHGMEGTMDAFRNIGLPQSGFSVCQQSCRCQLLPLGYKGENLDKKLIRGRNNSKKDRG